MYYDKNDFVNWFRATSGKHSVVNIDVKEKVCITFPSNIKPCSHMEKSRFQKEFRKKPY